MMRLWLLVVFLLRFCGGEIGDRLSSDSSSHEFFVSLDSDQDGRVGGDEIRNLVQGFGGKALDEPDEIDHSVEVIMSRMDMNNDRTVSRADLNTFLLRVGNILPTVESVAEWVTHAVQLPPEVGEKFRAASVTGYDFAELVEDDGLALKEDIAIERVAYRKKLLRAIRMMMTGVGEAPEAPSPFAGEAFCSAASLHWGKPDGRGFSVHKYRLFRKFTSHSVGLDTDAHGELGELVYEGQSTVFEDRDTRPATIYEYRVEAWNLFGKSHHATAIISTPSRAVCTTQIGLVREAFQLAEVFWAVSYRFLGFVWPLFALLTAVMRFKRTTHHRDSTDKWIDRASWRLLRFLSRVTPGSQHIIPKSLLIDPDSGQAKALYTVKHDGSASPAALGTQNVQNMLPPELGGRKSSDCNIKECYHCSKPFKFIIRNRHHCAECLRPFCASHGRTNHSRFTACPMDGSCICYDCINLQSRDNARLPETSSPALRPLSRSSSEDDFLDPPALTPSTRRSVSETQFVSGSKEVPHQATANGQNGHGPLSLRRRLFRSRSESNIKGSKTNGEVADEKSGEQG